MRAKEPGQASPLSVQALEEFGDHSTALLLAELDSQMRHFPGGFVAGGSAFAFSGPVAAKALQTNGPGPSARDEGTASNSQSQKTSIHLHNMPSPSIGGPIGSETIQVGARILVNSKREEELLRELAHARKEVSRLLRGSHGGGMGSVKEAGKRAKRLLDELAALVDEHQRLQRRCRLLRNRLGSIEREQCWAIQSTPLVKQAQLLASPADARPGSSGALVSVLELPLPHNWDRSWDERVRSLQVRDLLFLHRQWLQHSAVPLPKVQFMRGSPSGDQAARQLEELFAKYDCFSQRVMRLAPCAWNEMLDFDLDTMALLREKHSPEFMGKFWYHHLQDEAKLMFPVWTYYANLRAELEEEGLRLQERYTQSAAAGGLRGQAAAHGPPASVSALLAGSLAADDVLALLHANMLKQEELNAAFMHAVNYSVPVEVMLKIKLALYPCASNWQTLIKIRSPTPSAQWRWVEDLVDK